MNLHGGKGSGSNLNETRECGWLPVTQRVAASIYSYLLSPVGGYNLERDGEEAIKSAAIDIWNDYRFKLQPDTSIVVITKDEMYGVFSKLYISLIGKISTDKGLRASVGLGETELATSEQLAVLVLTAMKELKYTVSEDGRFEYVG